MINIVYEPESHRSAAYDGDQVIGVCEYEVNGNEWLITHTVVSPEYGGQGIARKLVLLVADKAKEAGKTIVPICSYAVKVLG